jgi:hypothetical protein
MLDLSIAAVISLDPSDEGGLSMPLPSGTPSVILELGVSSELVQFGTIILTEGNVPLEAGAQDIPVIVQFWVDHAKSYARPGVKFDLWYGGHIGHSVKNLNPVSSRVNQLKANAYSENFNGPGSGTVRDWLNGQTFEAQREYGLRVTAEILKGLSP